MKLCKDCRHARRDWLVALQAKLLGEGSFACAECLHPSLGEVDSVTGVRSRTYCSMARTNGMFCGHDARLFEPRKAAS